MASMSRQTVKRYELVEMISSGASGNTLGFPLLQDLTDDASQDIIITGIETFSAEEVTQGPTGGTVIALADLQKVYLTLYITDIDQALSIKRVPLIRLRPVFSGVANSHWVFDTLGLENLKVIWEKSYLELSGGWAGVGNPLLGITYKKLPPGAWARIQGNKIPGW